MTTPMHGSHVPGGNHRQADLEDELAADGLDLTPTRDEVGVPGVPTAQALEGRSELAIYLLPSAFPASPLTLLDVAQSQAAPPEILERLGRLPTAMYRTVEEVWEALGGPSESRPLPPEPRPAPAARPAPVVAETATVEPESPPPEEPSTPPWVDAIATQAGQITERTVRIVLGAAVHGARAATHVVRLSH